jgi:general secretion pathway protein D
VLGDIPLLGWLFKAKRSQVTKSNLLIFITPHIIRQYESVRAVLDQKLKERDDFIESAVGGEDLHRGYRDRIIRSLPDKSQLNARVPPKAVTLGEDEGAREVPESDNVVPPRNQRQAPSAPGTPPGAGNPPPAAPGTPANPGASSDPLAPPPPTEGALAPPPTDPLAPPS